MNKILAAFLVIANSPSFLANSGKPYTLLLTYS